MSPSSSTVSFDTVRGTVRVRFAAGEADDPGLRRRFMARVFSCPQVTRIDFRRRPLEAELHLESPREDRGEVLRALGRALAGNRCLAVPDDACLRLPVMVQRVGGRLTTWQVVPVHADRLRFSHPRLRRDRTLARRVQRLALATPGVRAARLTGWASDLVIDVDRSAFVGDPLLASLQREVDGAMAGQVSSAWEMAGTTATLGVAAATDLAVSALAPVSAVLLVGSNLRTLKAAATDLLRGRIGLPAVTSAIVIGTLATGQFLASGVMAWSFDFWRRRHRRDVEAERQLLIEAAVPLAVTEPTSAAIQTSSDLSPVTITAGTELPLSTGDVVPADGRITTGSGVIDDRSVSGMPGARGVVEGQSIPAGAVVLGGRFSMITEKPLAETRLAMVGRMLEEATTWRPGQHAPTRQAEEFGGKFAVPTLATAGLGLLAGDVATAVAVMRPDYSNGEAIAASFEDLEAVSRALDAGAVIRSPQALDRLCRVDTLVLCPYPGLMCGRLEVARIVRDMNDGVASTGKSTAGAPSPGRQQTERDSQAEVIRWAASLAMHVADERREALAELAASRRIALISLEPEAFGDHQGVRIQARHGKRELVIHEAVPERDGFRPLVFEVDGRPVATFEFGRSTEPRAATVIDRLRQEHGIGTVLLAEAGTAGDAGGRELAAALRCDGVICVGEEGPRPCLEGLVRAGRRLACVGPGRDLVGLQAAGITIELGTLTEPSEADILMLAADIGRIPDLVAAGRDRSNRRAVSRRLTILPNALCVAGAFFFGFTSLVVAVICNLTTFGTYRQSLQTLTRERRRRGIGSQIVLGRSKR